MVDNHSNQNNVVRESDTLKFRPNQIYIVNEPFKFQNVENRLEFAERENGMIDLKEISYCEETGVSCLGRRGDEHLDLFQMLWTQPNSEYQAHFMALNEIDVTEQNHSVSQNHQIPVFEIFDSDEDDDVVFVKSYPRESSNTEETSESFSYCPESKHGLNLRRNPSRKARNKKFGKISDDDNIYEEDFCMLDSSDDESSPVRNAQKSPPPKEETSQKYCVNEIKVWPVNGLHERPEYNAVTQKIEKFDYTIRDIQNTAKNINFIEKKKPKPRKPPAVKKYIPRKKLVNRKFSKKQVTKVPISSMSDLIEENYEMLSNFIENINIQNKQGKHVCHKLDLGTKSTEHIFDSSKDEEFKDHSVCLKNYQVLMKNQSRLYSLIKEVSFQSAYHQLKTIFD